MKTISNTKPVQTSPNGRLTQTLIVLLFFLFSCNKIHEEQSGEMAATGIISTAASEITANHIGDPNRMPNLYIPEHETGWAYPDTAGLWNGFKNIRFTTGVPVLYYVCLIANGIKGDIDHFVFDTTGKKDFVVCRSCDGIIDSIYQGSYDFPGMLSLKLYKDGTFVGPTIKQRFFVEDTHYRDNPPFYWHGHGDDTMYITYGHGDEYQNRINLPYDLSFQPLAGKYVLRVEINPDGLITESNYDDNVSFLPMYIQGSSVVTDQSAMPANTPAPVTNLTYIQNQTVKGVKSITLSWASGAEEFSIYKDGVLIAEDMYDKSFTYSYRGNLKSAVFSVVAENESIGKSTAVNINYK